jgi:hypothetical protein
MDIRHLFVTVPKFIYYIDKKINKIKGILLQQHKSSGILVQFSLSFKNNFKLSIGMWD